MTDVFLCHAGADKDWTRLLSANLRKQGLSVFFDEESFIPGESHVTALDRALRQCRKAIVVCSDRTVESGWAQKEIATLLERGTKDASFRVIPAVLSGGPANLPLMNDLTHVDFRDGSDAGYRLAFGRMLAGLRDQPGSETGSGVFSGTRAAAEAWCNRCVMPPPAFRKRLPTPFRRAWFDDNRMNSIRSREDLNASKDSGADSRFGKCRLREPWRPRQPSKFRTPERAARDDLRKARRGCQALPRTRSAQQDRGSES